MSKELRLLLLIAYAVACVVIQLNTETDCLYVCTKKEISQDGSVSKWGVTRSHFLKSRSAGIGSGYERAN